MAKNNSKIKAITKKDLEDLSKNGGNLITLSFYLGIRVSCNVRCDFASEANSVIADKIKKIKESKDYSNEQKKKIVEIAADLKKKIKFLKLPEGARSIVFFSGKEKEYKMYYLPIYMPSVLVAEADPYIHPLVKALENFPRYLVAAVDRDRAEFFSIFLGRIEGEPEAVTSDVPKKIKTSASDDWMGRREKRIERHIEDHLNRHFKLVASKIQDYFRKNEFGYLIIGGHEELTAKFKDFLDNKSAKKLIGIFTLPHYNHRFIKEKSIALISESEKNLEEKTVNDLLDGINTRKWRSIAGTDSVIKNLERRNISLLVVGRNYKETGYQCSNCHYISSREKVCPKCGKEMSKANDLADEIIEEAIGRKIEIKHLFFSHKEFDKFGIGAFLNSPIR